MPLRLVALDEGSDIPVDRAMIVVGRHPNCDARLESIRVSRRHCCMTPEGAELLVRDLGSTNGIRINGQRVDEGRLRPGDELAIAHLRFRLDDGAGLERTLAASFAPAPNGHGHGHVNGLSHHALGPAESNVGLALVVPPDRSAHPAVVSEPTPAVVGSTEDGPPDLAAAFRKFLPPELAGCRIQVILEPPDAPPASGVPAGPSSEIKVQACPPGSSP